MTYTKEDLCGPPANAQGWLDPGTLHKALMTNLQAGQQYYYIYGDEVCHLSCMCMYTWVSMRLSGLLTVHNEQLVHMQRH